jgi:hypothetical protein
MVISSFKSAWCLELSGYSLFLVRVRDIFVVVWRMCVMECMKQTIYGVPRTLNTLGTKFFILVVVFGVNHLASNFGRDCSLEFQPCVGCEECPIAKNCISF